jgi:hypothetical protein
MREIIIKSEAPWESDPLAVVGDYADMFLLGDEYRPKANIITD